MPTDPLLPEGRDFPRNRSPDSAGNGRKRRRKVLSCWDCRRRKLQCDRQLPACGRCTKAGKASRCLYLEDSSDAPLAVRDLDLSTTSASSLPGRLSSLYGHSARPIGVSAPPAGDILSRLQFQDVRIKQLEAALAQAPGPAPGGSGGAGGGGGIKGPRVPPTPESLASGDAVGLAHAHAQVQDRETTLLRGRSFKTQFHGNTHPGSLIVRIPELHGFTRDVVESFPALARIKEDMSAFEMRMLDKDHPHKAVSDAELKALLPSKPETDPLVHLYLDSYNALYYVYHLPSFWEEYNLIWADQNSARTHFIALVLSMIAAAYCLTDTQPWLYHANSSAAREKAVATISAVDDWLMAQSQKHVTAIDFQIRVVLLIAKQVAARKFKRTWTESGSVLRFCMAAGLHRTPDLIRKPTSLLDRELRKRVWAAVTELELQAAFDRGMVSTPWPMQSDCPPPIHVSDGDLDATTEHLPALRKPHEFCNASYLGLASESILLRHDLNTYLNNIRQPVCFEETKRYTEEIEAHLQAIPEWIEPDSEIPRVMMGLNMRQYLVTLHDRQLRVAESKAEQDFSRVILAETTSKMIEAHKSLTSKGIYALELLCQDQVRAALSLCHIASLNPHADDTLTRIIDESAQRTLPDAIEMLTDKVNRFGREQRQLWILVAAHGFMKCKKDPSRRTEYMQEAVDRITRPYYKILASQDESIHAHAPLHPSTAATSASASALSMKDPDSAYLSGATPRADRDANLPLDAQPMLDLDEIAAWTFEDWSFNPAEFAAAFPADDTSFGATPDQHFI